MLESFNLFDIVFFLFLLFFALSSKNFIYAFFDLAGFIFTVVLSYMFYLPVAKTIVQLTGISRGFGQVLAFFIVWFLSETILFILVRVLLARIPKFIYDHPLNKWTAFLPAVIQGCIFFHLITITIFSLPVRAPIKQEILNSRSGPYMISMSHTLESRIKNIFGDAVSETLNFITIKEGSEENVDLGFKVTSDKLYIDEQSEKILFGLVNKERRDAGVPELTFDSSLQSVGRSYAKEMFENGFFSHESAVDGSTPAQRVARNNIPYMVTGENLAYAPEVYLAHQGLMNSPGHRANILSPEYRKIGIGVIDGGINGRMFVQEFTD